MLAAACTTAMLGLTVVGMAGADAPGGPGGTAQADDGLVVQDLTHGATPQNMAQSLVGGGVTISNVVYTGANNAAGTFVDTGPGSVVGFSSGIILGSGSVQTTSTSTACSKGVEGPNQCDYNRTVNGTPGDADLTALSGKTTFDAAVLQFDFVPQFSTVQFAYVFSSDEYNEYANTTYNDTFGFLVNGQNCALVPGTSTPVGVNTINGGNPYGVNPQNPAYFRNNDLSDGGGSINTEMDGLTVVLTCNANVNAGATNHLKLAISDASDQYLDSNVFIKAGSLISGTQISTTLSGGGQSGSSITVPTGTTVIDQATLSGANAGTAAGTVTYTVYSDSNCTTSYANAGTKPVTNGNVPPSDPVAFVASGNYYWIASYSGDSANNPSSTACGSEVVTVSAPKNLDLSIVKAGPALAQSGGSITYQITVSNAGPADATNVTVNDPLPAGETLISATASQGSCGNAVICNLGAILNGGSATVTIVANVTASSGSTLANTATVSGDLLDSNPANNSSTTSAFVYGVSFGGSFVIGDNNAAVGASVMFWGAQWWKRNSLTGGAAPAAFKGFENTPTSVTCGTSWSTGPGNSPPPPAGPLPAYMAVIVSSSIGRSGSSISGNTVQMVIVHTNAGYAADPGHAGTGTVFAQIC